MQSQRPTVALVAERAGVSVASVSRALNGLPTSAATLQRVRQAAQELGYAPNAQARSLKVRRTEQLALAVSDIGNPVYVDMMRAIEAETRAEGYRLLVSSHAGRAADMMQVFRSLDSGYADGLILSPLRVEKPLQAALRRTSFPVVVIGTVPPDVGVDDVRANSAGGVRLALEHLHEQGTRRVAFVNGPVDTVPGSARARAFARVARKLGLDEDPALRVMASDFTVSAGLAAADRLLRAAQPDAVLGANDLLAIGVMKHLHDRGLSVPHDVAVVGMDDTELATVTTPSLSSVSLGSAERGRAAARLLLERLAEPARQPQRITMQPRLRVRESSRRRRDG